MESTMEPVGGAPEKKFLTLDEIKQRTPKRQSGEIYIEELGGWVEVRGLTFGDQMEAVDWAQEKGPDGQGKPLSDVEIRAHNLRLAIVRPEIPPDEVQVIKDLHPKAAQKLAVKIALLSGAKLSKEEGAVLDAELFTEKRAAA